MPIKQFSFSPLVLLPHKQASPFAIKWFLELNIVNVVCVCVYNKREQGEKCVAGLACIEDDSGKERTFQWAEEIA